MMESIERQALLSWRESVARRGMPGYQWRLRQIGDLLCSISSSEQSILVNRVFGFGPDTVPTEEQLREVRQAYSEAGVSRFFLHVVPPRTTEVEAALLTRAGFRRYRGWIKFRRGRDPLPDTPATDLEVRQISPDEAGAFAAIAAPAFDLSAPGQRALAALADDPDWRLYMSFDRGNPAGTGALYLRGETGYLDWAATHLRYRGRGSQRALIGRRISDALNAGCTTLTTMTGESVPGDPQHSYNNILRAGFGEAYLRENWIPAEEAGTADDRRRHQTG
jgi:GNAT superfamily N-acetyltransferase